MRGPATIVTHYDGYTSGGDVEPNVGEAATIVSHHKQSADTIHISIADLLGCPLSSFSYSGKAGKLNCTAEGE